MSNFFNRMLQRGDFAKLGLADLPSRHPIKSRTGRKTRIIVDRTGVREVKVKRHEEDDD